MKIHCDLIPGEHTAIWRTIRPGTATVLLYWEIGSETRHIVFSYEGNLFWTVEPVKFNAS